MWGWAGRADSAHKTPFASQGDERSDQSKCHLKAVQKFRKNQQKKKKDSSEDKGSLHT
jgi:hypothetical protein